MPRLAHLRLNSRSQIAHGLCEADGVSWVRGAIGAVDPETVSSST